VRALCRRRKRSTTTSCARFRQDRINLC
jgi:hypothetical protein